MEEHPFTRFLTRHALTLVVSFCLVVTGFLFFERFSTRRHNHSKRDYITALASLEHFYSGYPIDLDALESMGKLVENHPSFHPRFDTALRTSFLLSDATQKATPLFEQRLRRIEGLVDPNLLSFSKTSLLIAENKLGQAYLEAEKLATHHTGDTLETLNLLRLVFLAKEAGNVERLLSSFEQLKAQPLYNEILPLFSEGTVSLSDYVSL